MTLYHTKDNCKNKVHFGVEVNAGHKWRASETIENIEGASVGINQYSSKPYDITRPSSCLCYAMGLFADTVSDVLTGIIRRSISDQILRFIIRKSYSVCRFSQN